MPKLPKFENYFPKPEVLKVAGNISPSTLDREIAAGRFPRPVRLSRNRIAWRESDLRKWQEAR
jgi:prophage regulatory protein